MHIKHLLLPLLAGLLVNASFAAADNDTTKRVTENFSGSYVSFVTDQDVGASSLTITGPNRFSAQGSAESVIPAIELSEFGSLDDGLYIYQITAALAGQFMQPANKSLNNGRGNKEAKRQNKVIKQSGSFHLESGEIKHFINQTHSVKKVANQGQ
ncbi:MAG: hypothetical protein ACI9C4_001461 [Paraglaciecola sp.]|jgi:hypothetical protein